MQYLVYNCSGLRTSCHSVDKRYMTKSCLFVPVIDIMMIRNTPEEAAITRIELMSLKRKCYCKVAIFNASASSTYLP